MRPPGPPRGFPKEEEGEGWRDDGGMIMETILWGCGGGLVFGALQHYL